MTVLFGFRSRFLVSAFLIALPTMLTLSPSTFAAGASITDSTPQKKKSASEGGPTDPQLHELNGMSPDAATGPAKPASGVRSTLRELLQSWLPSSESDEEAGTGETAEAEGGTPEALDGNVIAPTDVLSKDELAHAIPWRPTNFDGQKGALGWSPTTFDIPDAFKNRVGFWRDIYAKYSTDQGVIHDTLYINFIYATMDFSAISKDSSKTSAQKARAREAMIKDKKKEVSARLAKLKGHSTAEGLTGEDLRFWKLFEKINDPQKFEEASDKGRVRFQLGQRDKFVLGIFYSGRYLRTMEKIFRDEGLPMELTRLPFVESSFNVNARSRVGASGVWQFMRRTAKPFMKVNRDVDERNDPIRATRASARVLKQNFVMLESWPLALTGYNHGPYGVRGIVNKTHTRDLGEIIAKYSSRTFGFASENFYACFLAALDVERHSHKYFGDVKWSGEIESTEVKVSSNTPYRTLVDLFGGDLSLTEMLNPHFSSRVRTGRAPIPKGSSIRVLPAVAAIAGQAVSGKLGGTRLAVAVKAVAKDISPLKDASATASATNTVASGGMQSSVRSKIEQVGLAAQAAMPTLTMADSKNDGSPAINGKLESFDKLGLHQKPVKSISTIGAPPRKPDVPPIVKAESLGDGKPLAAEAASATVVVSSAPRNAKEAGDQDENGLLAAGEVALKSDAAPEGSKPTQVTAGSDSKPVADSNSAGAAIATKASPAELKTHKVKRGENLTHIASEYGVDIQELQKLNHLESRRGHRKGQIRVGQILTIPGLAIAPNVDGSARAAASPIPNGSQTSGAEAESPTSIRGSIDGVHDANGEKVLDAKVLPGATATPSATPHVNTH